MTAFTRLGSSLWDWEPWVELPTAESRLLWLAFYTSAEAKRHVPGLWQGGFGAMADAARMPVDVVISALDVLITRELVEYDRKFKVLRLCELPDAGEYPTNGKVIRSWWTRFNTVPQCPVRDAHVRTISWILETGSKQVRSRTSKDVTVNHLEAWSETFGQIVVPIPRRRGVRSLAESDTGTNVQPSLFPSQASYESPVHRNEPGCPQVQSHAVDNSDSVRQLNDINGPETLSDRVSDRNRIPDPGSRIPEFSSSDSGSGMVVGGERTPTQRPALSLVPPYSAAEVLAEMAKGNWDPAFDFTLQPALGAMIPAWVAQGVGLADLALLAEHSVHSQRRLNVRWMLGCDMKAEVSTARRALEWRDVRAQAMAGSLP
jgi:hypothetical protein